MKKYFILIFLAVCFILNVNRIYGQNLDESIPVDPNLITGKLDNGLSYYIRKNVYPEQRAEFWLVVNAGAIQEDDDQNGLAHFCEHMAFNGTKNFKKHEIIRYLQSIGMKFGPEINAFTNTDVTNFMLQNVPVNQVQQIDTSLMILYDWACQVSYEDEEIEKERGVIHEEWRTRRGADARMMFNTYEKLYYGSKYASRNVIGELNIIDSCPPDVLRRFYKDWYRPDLQAIIAVGDFDIREVEGKIKSMFSQIPKAVSPRTREVPVLPPHKETFVAVESDREATQNRINMYIKRPANHTKTLKDLRYNIASRIFATMASARISEIMASENPPFLGCFMRDINLVRANDAFMVMTMARPGETDKAFMAASTELERMLRYGFSEAELQRAKDKLLASYEKSYNERNKQENNSFAWEYYSMFLDETPAASIEFEYQFAKSQLPAITAKEIHDMLKSWVKEEDRVITITGPLRDDIKPIDPGQVFNMLAMIKKSEIKPWIDKSVDKPLMDMMPKAGNVKKETVNKELGVTILDLSNGAKVILKKTDYKDDEILFKAFSHGGYAQYPPSAKSDASFAADVAVNSGINQFSKTDLEKYLSGKVARVSPYIEEYAEGLTGQSSVKDLETLFQLTNLYFTHPRFDSIAYVSYMGRIKALITNQQNDPNKAVADTFQNTVNQYNPYRLPLSVEMIEQTSFSAMKKLFPQRFSSASDFIFVFVGSFNIEKIKPLIINYIASLPSPAVNEKPQDIGLKMVSEQTIKQVTRKLEVSKSTVYLAIRGNFSYSQQNRVLLSAATDILSVRLTETIREEESGTYGASVRTSFNKFPFPYFTTTVRFDCSPDNAEHLTEIVKNEITALSVKGPDMKYVNDVKENKLKELAENLKKNSYWLQLIENVYFNDESDFRMAAYEELLHKLTPEMIQETAKQYFAGNKYVITTLKPE